MTGRECVLVKLIVTINLDDDAIVQHGGREVDRLLHQVAFVLSDRTHDGLEKCSGALVDVNGNTVGGYVVRGRS